MKTFTPTTLALLITVTASPHAEQRLAKELEPSLAILETVSTPMPDFRGVPFYTAFPDSQGRLVDGMGHSAPVRGWFRQMEPIIPRFVALDEELGTEIEFYADTVREEGAKVLGATANLRKALSDLDRDTSGRVQELLDVFNKQVRATRVARLEFDASSKRAEEAGYLVESTDAGATECNLVVKRAKLEAEKAALLDRVARDTAFLNGIEKAIDTMAGGPQAIASYLAVKGRDTARTIIIEAFHTGTRETLYEIGAKIEAIEKSLQDVKCRQQGAALKAAKANLEARTIQVFVAYGKILDHRADAWHTVNRLGTLKSPRTGRTVPFLEHLKTYNEEANVAGRAAFDVVNAYMEFLAKEPVSRGTLLVSYVDEDLETVKRDRSTRDSSGQWISGASRTRAYLGRYAKWYEGEVTRGQAILADLREGKHLDFVDRMLARAITELGGTVSYENIVR